MTDTLPAIDAAFFARQSDLERLPFQLKKMNLLPGEYLVQGNGLTQSLQPVLLKYRTGALTFSIDGHTVYQRPWHPEGRITEDVLREALRGVLEW